jgi:hypothetical protein
MFFSDRVHLDRVDREANKDSQSSSKKVRNLGEFLNLGERSHPEGMPSLSPFWGLGKRFWLLSVYVLVTIE